MEKKEDIKGNKGNIDYSDKYVKWLSELDSKSGSVAGGKGVRH